MSNFSKDNRPGGTYVMGGKEVSRVGYGTMQLPKLKDEAKARAVIRRAYELGVNHFDTADFYEDGFTNRCLADEIGKEKDAVIVTKIGAKPGNGIMPMIPAQRPEELRQHIEDNLRSLKTDHLGIVNFRRIAPGTFPLKPSQKVNFDDQMAELIKMRDEGKIEAIGLSTVSLKELQSALPAGIVCVQNQYNITSRSQESILDLCRKEGIAWVPYFPLGGGLPGSAKVTEDKTVQAVAKEMGLSPVQVGLAWILQHAENALIIPGTTSVGHLEQNVAVGDTGETLDALNDAEADTVKVVLRETDFTPIPYGNSLQIVRNKIGKLLGISYRACLVSEDDRYFQMEYSREAKAVDWGADFVLTDDYDEVVRFTAEDGREFIIKTFGDRLWAESVTAWETYYCYGIGMSIEDAENVLNNMWVTAAGAAAK